MSGSENFPSGAPDPGGIRGLDWEIQDLWLDMEVAVVRDDIVRVNMAMILDNPVRGDIAEILLATKRYVVDNYGLDSSAAKNAIISTYEFAKVARNIRALPQELRPPGTR